MAIHLRKQMKLILSCGIVIEKDVEMPKEHKQNVLMIKNDVITLQRSSNKQLDPLL